MKELKHLGGCLGHCATVVHRGRSFTTRTYDAIGTLKQPFHKFRLNAAFCDEIKWWLQFVDRFNGYAKMLRHHAPVISVYTDASDRGFGAFQRR